MKLALAQFGATTDKAHNLAQLREFATRAAADGAELVVFPEFTMYEKKVVDASFAEAAEPLDGPFCLAVAEVAAMLGIAVTVGVVERNDHDFRPFNTLVAIGPAGERLARYRKVHLFDSYGFRESDAISPAESLDPVVFTVADITVGLMTCYDLRFPELGRELADAGAQVMLACSSWVPGEMKVEQWRVLAQARAIENGCYVGAVSQTPPTSIGRSLFVTPMGNIAGQLDEEPALGIFDAQPREVSATRERDPALLRRRYLVTRRQ